MRTHYDTLNVAHLASREVITKAYRALAKQHHPDLNGGDPESTRIFQMLNDSYDVLSDPARRTAYDAWIGMRQMGWGEFESEEAAPTPPYHTSPSPPAASPPNSAFVPPSARWALWLGLAAFVFHLIGIAAVIYGHKARREFAQSNGNLSGEGYAVTGLIFGYQALAMFALVIYVVWSDR